MTNGIKTELERTKLHLEFYKARNEQDPNKIYTKWVEIYADRAKKLERQLTKLEQLVARPKNLALTSKAAGRSARR